jgi:hypothetical protein
LRLKGKIQEFNPGTTGEVIAINDDENQGKPLTRFQSAIVMSALGTRVRTQNIDVNLDQLNLPGFAIRSVSPLDPSGWARINLVRTEGTPLRQTQPGQDLQTPPTHGPAVPGSTTPQPTGAAAANPTTGSTAPVTPAGVPVANAARAAVPNR